jgi:hypothetical protein
VLETASRDAQPLGTTQMVYRDLKGLYDRVGAGDRLCLAAVQGFHCSHSVRQLVYWTFNRDLGDPDAGVEETDSDLLPASAGADGRRQATPLDVAAHSSVVRDFASETAHTMLNGKAARLAAARPTPESAGGPQAWRREVRQRMRRCLAVDDAGSPPRVSVVDEGRLDGLRLRRLAWEVETGLPLSLDLYEAPRAAGATVLYLSDDGASRPAEAVALARAGIRVAALTVRGSGETAPLEDEVRFGLTTYATRRAHDALAVGRPLVGQQALDVLSAVQALEGLGASPPLTVVARGAAGLWGLFGAVESDRIGALAIMGCLASYRRFLSCRLPTWIQGDRESSVVVPGALAHFDLPDLVSLLAPRPVLLSGLVDGAGRALPLAEVEREYGRARRMYGDAGAPGRLEIADRDKLDGWQGLSG